MNPQNPNFNTTQWTLVLAAGKSTPAAQQALATLCQNYWFPLYAYLRRKGNPPESSEDLLQSFFERLIEHHDLAAADPARGRFRSFLLSSLKHFVANQKDHDRSAKRGGRARHFSLDFSSAEARYHREPASDATPEKLYHRRWAMDLLDNVLGALRLEYVQAGKEPIFDALKPALVTEPDAPSHAQIALTLHMTPDAVKTAIHRLRRRYGHKLREILSHTVATPDEIDSEIRDLFASLA